MSSLSLSELNARRADDQPSFRSLLPDPKRHKRAEAEPSEEERVKKGGQHAALAKLKASFAKGKAGQTSSSTATPAPVKKPNPVLDLMRLKGRAVPADPRHIKRDGDIPMPDRLFLKVEHAKEATEKVEVREVWVSKSITAGKALDLFADLFKVTNVNNATTDQTKLLSLALPDDPPIRLILSEPLSSQVTNGGKVRIYKGFQRP
ncbi:AN1-type zinc finger protein 1 [Rhodotorula toruloides]